MTDSIYPLVVHAARTGADEIPAEVLRRAAELLLDTIGCMLGGSSAEGVQALRDTVLFWGGNPVSRIVAYGDRTSPPQAAFLNSVMGHARDFDDTHDGALNHGCVTLVPAMLAVCESVSAEKKAGRVSGASGKVSGREFLASLAVGLDISNRLGMAFIPYLHVGWLPTTLWGPFACAAACGRLLGLNTEQMQHAFGLAYSQIHGNRQGLVDGALSKRMQPGFSASAGVQAAFFARQGLTGARNIVDGDFGIAALYTGGRFDADRLGSGIGMRYETLEVSIKPYPSCRCSHPVIDAALELKREHHIQWQDIAEATVYLPPPSMGQIGQAFQVRANPVVDAQFSAQYTAALAFVEGRPKLEHFRADFIRGSGDLLDLAARFKTQEFEPGVSTLTPVELHVALRNGGLVKTRVEHARGGPANPLSRAELLLKFHDCLDNAARIYTDTERRNIIECVEGVLELEDMSKLIELL